jgi:hypothetical protein
MSHELPIRIAVVCEARADYAIASALCDRVIWQVPWIHNEDYYFAERGERFSPANQESIREYQEYEQQPFVLWKRLKALQENKPSGFGAHKFHGRFNGNPGAADSQMTRYALLFLGEQRPPPQAILFIRDSDNDESRRAGMEQARDEYKARGGKIAIVIGLASPKRECWVLHGFLPKNDEETKRLQSESKALTFDPVKYPERLNAKDDGSLRDAKRLLDTLTEHSWERQETCWLETPLHALHSLGHNTGLTAYLNEVEKLIVPLFR